VFRTESVHANARSFRARQAERDNALLYDILRHFPHLGANLGGHGDGEVVGSSAGIAGSGILWISQTQIATAEHGWNPQTDT
jgi:hypothetical protein